MRSDITRPKFWGLRMRTGVSNRWFTYAKLSLQITGRMEEGNTHTGGNSSLWQARGACSDSLGFDVSGANNRKKKATTTFQRLLLKFTTGTRHHLGCHTCGRYPINRSSRPLPTNSETPWIPSELEPEFQARFRRVKRSAFALAPRPKNLPAVNF